jgi:hypothetical protein
MTTSTPTASVRAFLERFDAGSDADPASGAGLFHEQFLNLDPNAATVVSREQLRAVLPMRAQMFGSIGATGTRLRDVDVRPLDDLHVLAETTWDVELEDPDADPLVLHSTYLLRRAGEDWSVVVYLNHQDIGRVLAERRPA